MVLIPFIRRYLCSSRLRTAELSPLHPLQVDMFTFHPPLSLKLLSCSHFTLNSPDRDLVTSCLNHYQQLQEWSFFKVEAESQPPTLPCSQLSDLLSPKPLSATASCSPLTLGCSCTEFQLLPLPDVWDPPQPFLSFFSLFSLTDTHIHQQSNLTFCCSFKDFILINQITAECAQLLSHV